jgi:transglutaminase-like putative cysteine protease
MRRKQSPAAPPSTRPDRRRALAASTAWLVGPLLPMGSALARALIDDTDASIAALAERLVQGHDGTRARTVALHDHVRDAVRFGFAPQFYAMTAAEVLAAALGYGNTKATLFVALLRAAGIEARQRFVELPAAVWRGLIDLRTPQVDHCLTEVLIDGAWIGCDSYVVDATLFRAAQRALRLEGRQQGYGIDAEGRCTWDGREPAYAQFPAEPQRRPLRQWGVFADVAAFYEATPDAWNRRTEVMRVVFPLAALTANQTAEALRRHGPSAVRGGRPRARV